MLALYTAPKPFYVGDWDHFELMDMIWGSRQGIMELVGSAGPAAVLRNPGNHSTFRTLPEFVEIIERDEHNAEWLAHYS